MRKILLAMTTGRPVFRHTLKMLENNFAKFKHFDNYQVDVLVNYDPSFIDISREVFIEHANNFSRFNKVVLLGPESVPAFIIEMRSMGLDEMAASLLCQVQGFGNKKNLILWFAVKEQYDVVLFWDDDEYPVVCMKNEQDLFWHHTDILASHAGLSNDECDVATGFWTGHVFPTYPAIGLKMSRETAMKLGEALSLGTETHSADSFINLDRSFEIGSAIPSAREVFMHKGGKWVSGGNLSIRTAKLVDGTVPPYYTPRNSRGDDTIFSMGLSRAKVLLVPSGAFHDMYLEYDQITSGVYPLEIGYQATHNSRYLARFAMALKAWLAYAPLYIRLQSICNYASTVAEMEALLASVDVTLFDEFPELGLELKGQRLASIFRAYSTHTNRQYEELQICYDAWPKACSLLK